MDRQIVYPGSIPLDTDILSTQRNVMIALGFLAQATLGTSVVVDGLACTQQTVPNMTFNVGPGSIIALQNVDATTYGSLAADTTDPLLKMGINIASKLFTVTAPGTTGQSINYLIQAAFQEADATSVILPYYNPGNPAVAYSGPANSGAAQNTQRLQTVNVTMKTGTAATTGSQVTPTPDGGFVGLWVVTVAFAQTSVVTGNIAQLATAPFVQNKLPTLTPGFSRFQGFAATGNFTVPNGVTTAEVEVWAGGGGSGGAAPNNAGSGGAGGGYAKKIITGLTPGTVVTVTVGAGGAGGGAGAGGSPGGTSSFGAFVSATGGAAGAANSTTGSVGGTGVSGDTNILGQSGNGGSVVSTTACFGGSGGSAPRGAGGIPGGITSSLGAFNGIAGTVPGGGASGGASANGSGATPTGAAGGNGRVEVRW